MTNTDHTPPATAHTPEPWWLDDDGFIAAGSGDTYSTGADPHCRPSADYGEENEANARRIAACPTATASEIRFWLVDRNLPPAVMNHWLRCRSIDAERLLAEASASALSSLHGWVKPLTSSPQHRHPFSDDAEKTARNIPIRAESARQLNEGGNRP